MFFFTKSVVLEVLIVSNPYVVNVNFVGISKCMNCEAQS